MFHLRLGSNKLASRSLLNVVIEGLIVKLINQLFSIYFGMDSYAGSKTDGQRAKRGLQMFQTS